MKNYTSANNGMGFNGNKSEILNAHLSYNGRSIIVDYEFCLHCYSDAVIDGKDKYVPLEIYPYSGSDIHVDYVEVDEEFHKADIAKIIEIVDKAIENEPEPYDWMGEME